MAPDPIRFLSPIIIGSETIFGILILAGFFLVRSRLRGSEVAERHTINVVAILLVGWFLITLWLSQAGIFRGVVDGPFPPNIAYGISLPIIVGILLISYSKAFGPVLDAVPHQWIIGVQVYRCLGIVFLVLYANGLLPGAFALPAGYGDLFVGVTAPVVAYLYVRRAMAGRNLILAWNVVGIADLVMAVALGFVSSPGPFQLLSLDTPNEMISAYPLVMVPAFAVPLSILLHVCSLRKLRREVGN